MSAVLRWTVPVDDEPHVLDLSGGVLFVDCRDDPGTVEVWTLDSGGPTVARTFRVFGTGHPVPDGWEYVGTALTPMEVLGLGQRKRGALVWHLFERLP